MALAYFYIDIKTAFKRKILNDSSIRFSHSFRKTTGAHGSVDTYTIFVRERDGTILGPPMEVTVGGTTLKVSRAFTLKRTELKLVETGDNPWLYGYASQLVPKSPDPDETLRWEGE